MEEILEIERTSSLLASAIDQTIKSIEEYKEEVGIENKKQTENNGLIYNGYAKIIETKVFNTDKFENHIMDDSKTHIQDSKKQAADTKTNGLDMNGYSEVRLAVIDHDFEVNNNENKIDKVNEEIKKLESEVLMNNIEAVPVTIDERKVEIDEPKVDISDPKPEIDEPRVEIPDISHLLTPDREIGKKDPMEGYRPVQFDLEELKSIHRNLRPVYNATNGEQKPKREMYKSETGEMLGTHQGIVDGLEEAVVDDDVAKELGKPGIPEEKIAELISGESEMLREAHVMGLSRVLSSHMHRANDDDSSVDFNKIKPVLESLKDSEVLKALNEELKRTREETKKKEERNWTTFLLKPERPVPKVKSGYHGWVDQEQNAVESYKVKIVKQPKPKIAPDYKPEVFETGLLPWEERALREPTPPPVEPEEPILIPEEPPEVFEAVDPLPESEVPDLEDSGIPLPPPKPIKEPPQEEEEKEEAIELDLEAVIEETEKIVEENLEEEMDQVKIADQVMMSVQNMVDPNAPLEQQLAQMRAQLAALAQLPCVIQQSLELVTRQLTQLSQMESSQTTKQSETSEMKEEEGAEEVAQNNCAQIEVAEVTQKQEEQQIGMEEEKVEEDVKPTVTDVKPTITAEELERMKREEEAMMDEQRKIEKQKKELMEQMRVEQESRQLKHRATPRVGKPKPVFGPATPQERPLVLPGGRKWRKPKDAYNEAFIAETLAAQAEIIQGKAKGCSFESARLPYDERINFLKYEKPPVSLDHLHNSDTYKMVHDMEQAPLKRVEMRTPVICEADYREKCRSVTPCMDFPQQVRP